MGTCAGSQANTRPKALISPTKIVVITGASSGIGFEIVKHLIYYERSFIVVLTARDLHKGLQAVKMLDPKKLYADRVLFMRLDVTEKNSMERFVGDVRTQFGYVDVLINNAGINPEGWDFSPKPYFPIETARSVLETNFYGAVNLTECLLPLFRPGGLIVNIGSKLAKFHQLSNSSLRRTLSSPSLTHDQLLALANQYLAAVSSGTHRHSGWPEHNFVVSKMLLHAYTLELSRRVNGTLRVHAACPGWSRTNIGGLLAPRSAEAGARTPLAVITSKSQATGQFWEDGDVSDFE